MTRVWLWAVVLVAVVWRVEAAVEEEDGGSGVEPLNEDADLLAAARLEQVRSPILAAPAFSHDSTSVSLPAEDTIKLVDVNTTIIEPIDERPRRKPTNPKLQGAPGVSSSQSLI